MQTPSDDIPRYLTCPETSRATVDMRQWPTFRVILPNTPPCTHRLIPNSPICEAPRSQSIRPAVVLSFSGDRITAACLSRSLSPCLGQPSPPLFCPPQWSLACSVKLFPSLAHGRFTPAHSPNRLFSPPLTPPGSLARLRMNDFSCANALRKDEIARRKRLGLPLDGLIDKSALSSGNAGGGGGGAGKGAVRHQQAMGGGGQSRCVRVCVCAS